VAVVVVALDRRILDRAVHALDLPIGPSMASRPSLRLLRGPQAGAGGGGWGSLLRDKGGMAAHMTLQSSKGRRVRTRTATTAASFSSARTVLFRCAGPVGRSKVEERERHFLTVFRSSPSWRASVAVGSWEDWIWARTCALAVALPGSARAMGCPPRSLRDRAVHDTPGPSTRA